MDTDIVLYLFNLSHLWFYKHIAVLCWIILMKLSCVRVLKS